ncbi:hypothetical protein C7212DRAFT_344180 [Tuber magnatum]|uniref:Uncharacterized protein n=1 Tax=Tuber magnatum TaxID=42249 RepID=A0A317SQ83_9PEZI|nr:hypothetical protein C7212DRAFT_344180 [Tuber magnatum]
MPTRKMIPYLRTLFEYHLYRAGKYGPLDKCLRFMHDQMVKLAREHKLHAGSSRTRLAQRLALDALLVTHMGHGDAAFVVLLKFAGRKTTENLIDWDMFEAIRMRKKIACASTHAVEDRLSAVFSLCSEKSGYEEPGFWAMELIRAKMEDQMGKYRVLEADKKLRLRALGPGSKKWSQDARKHALDMAEKDLGIPSPSSS